MGTVGFYFVGTVGFAFIAYLLITGGLHMRIKSSPDRSSRFGKLESIVSTVMLIVAVLAVCSACIVLFTWVTS